MEKNMKMKVVLKKKYGGKGQGFDGGHASYYSYRDYYVTFEEDGQTIHEELITMFIPKDFEKDPEFKDKWEILDLIDGNFTFKNFKIPGSILIEYCINHPPKQWYEIGI